MSCKDYYVNKYRQECTNTKMYYDKYDSLFFTNSSIRHIGIEYYKIKHLLN
jgi:hypothetical protein